MNKIPTAEEVYNEFPHNTLGYISKGNAIAMAIALSRLHVKAALEAAVEKAELKGYPYNSCHECGREDMDIDKNSIFNAYPENLIQ